MKKVSEIKKLRKPVRDVNKEHVDNLSGLNKVALSITNNVGTMGFFIAIFVWTVLWLGWNIFAPTEYRFDPVPSCVFWLFISNMIQIFLMPLLMIGQNIQSKHAESVADADYEINIKSEREVEHILIHIEEQQIILKEILEKLKSK